MSSYLILNHSEDEMLLDNKRYSLSEALDLIRQKYLDDANNNTFELLNYSIKNFETSEIEDIQYDGDLTDIAQIFKNKMARKANLNDCTLAELDAAVHFVMRADSILNSSPEQVIQDGYYFYTSSIHMTRKFRYEFYFTVHFEILQESTNIADIRVKVTDVELESAYI